MKKALGYACLWASCSIFLTSGKTYRKKKAQHYFVDVREREKERAWSVHSGFMTVDSGWFLSQTVSGTSVLLLLHHAESDSALQHLHREPRIVSGLILRLERGENNCCLRPPSPISSRPIIRWLCNGYGLNWVGVGGGGCCMSVIIEKACLHIEV